MHLNSMTLRRVSYGEREGQIDGEVTFANPKGEIKLMLTPEQVAGILTVCAEAIVRSTQECAAVMTANILTQLPQIAAPEAGHD
jgi:hypothetical protein